MSIAGAVSQLSSRRQNGSNTERRNGERQNPSPKSSNSRSIWRWRTSNGRHSLTADVGSAFFSSVFRGGLLAVSAMARSSCHFWDPPLYCERARMILIWVKYEPRSFAGDALLHKPSRYCVTQRAGSHQQGWNHWDPTTVDPTGKFLAGPTFTRLRYS